MNIAIIGFGKMGHLVRDTAIRRGHTVVLTVDITASDADFRPVSGDASGMVRTVKSCGADSIIDFSHPSAVVGNIKALLPLGIPMVVGTTGWSDREKEIAGLAQECGGTVMHSSNFSIGVYMFYKIVENAVSLMKPYEEYDTAVWEMHHNQKADSPSGTALEIAHRIMANNEGKAEIITDAFHEKPRPDQLHVSSTRCGSVPGTHTVFFDSPADTIEITHRARNREGFASGAVTAAERLVSGIKTGTLKRGNLYTMEDIF
jgi:4-hydroxy-tetrahydrodipicolinate reductase